jgi:hypothetical protein
MGAFRRGRQLRAEFRIQLKSPEQGTWLLTRTANGITSKVIFEAHTKEHAEQSALNEYRRLLSGAVK